MKNIDLNKRKLIQNYTNQIHRSIEIISNKLLIFDESINGYSETYSEIKEINEDESIKVLEGYLDSLNETRERGEFIIENGHTLITLLKEMTNQLINFVSFSENNKQINTEMNNKIVDNIILQLKKSKKENPDNYKLQKESCQQLYIETEEIKRRRIEKEKRQKEKQLKREQEEKERQIEIEKERQLQKDQEEKEKKLEQFKKEIFGKIQKKEK